MEHLETKLFIDLLFKIIIISFSFLATRIIYYIIINIIYESREINLIKAIT